MKILFLSPSLRKGGAENQMVKLCIYLVGRGYDVEIVTFMPGNDFKSFLSKHHIPLVVRNLNSIIDFIYLVKYVRKQKPDIVITFMFAANLVGRFIKLFVRMPLITSVRANGMSLLYRFLYKFTYKLDTYSTFNSNYSHEQFIKKRFTVKEKSIVINNGIELNRSYDRQNYVIGDVFEIVSIAHFRKSKDYLTLFKALSKLKENGIKFKLTVLGNDYGQDWPKEMINELGICDNVDMKGFVENPMQFLQNADVLVLSSFLEGTPNAILEAMSKKVPVIASDIPGNDYVLKQSGAGYLFKLSDSNDLVKKLLDIYKLSDLERKELGEKGFQYIVNNYDLENVHKQWNEYIDKSIKYEI